MSDLAALYRRWLFELWQTPDERLAAELFTPGFVIHQAGAEWPTGPDAAVSLVRMGLAPFRNIELRIDVGPLVAGDFVSARWGFTGAYTGGIPSVPAAEATRVTFGGIDIMRAEGDRFAEYWVSSDGLDLMQQLGA